MPEHTKAESASKDNAEQRSAQQNDGQTQANQKMIAEIFPPVPGGAKSNDVKAKFDQIDTDHDNKVSVPELTKYLEDKIVQSAANSRLGEFAQLKDEYITCFKDANPDSKVTDIKDMVLTEKQTGLLQAWLPSYRSEELSKKGDSIFAGNGNSTEPVFDFKQLAHGKETMNFDDFLDASKSHFHFISQDQAAVEIKRANNPTDTKNSLTFDLNGTVDFSHFQSIYKSDMSLR